MTRQAVLCPICMGTGKYKESNSSSWTTIITYYGICHGCDGRGWVEIGEDDVQLANSGSGTKNTKNKL